jgi:hypothetical protein
MHQNLEPNASSPAPDPRPWLGPLALFCSLTLIGLIALGTAAAKYFWYDELVTLYVARFPTLKQIFLFFESGKDTTSFLPAMIVHAMLKVPGRPEVMTRLPFIATYLLMGLCVWIFMRRRYSVGYATAAVLLTALPVKYFYFATEIRAYVFAFLGTAFALVCWQAANRRGARRGLAAFGVFCGLSMALLFHAFAIFLFAPFVAAEAYHWWSKRDLRVSMVAAIVLFPATLAIMLPNIRNAGRLYGHTFWSKPTTVGLADVYRMFLDPLIASLPWFLLVFAFYAYYSRKRDGSDATLLGPAVEPGGFTAEEWVMLLAMSFTPVVGYMASFLLGVFRQQYMFYCMSGMVLLVVGAIAEVMRRRVAAGWAVLAVILLFMWREQKGLVRNGIYTLAGKKVQIRSPSEYVPAWDKTIQNIPLPIVADGPDTLLSVNQYAPANITDRLYILTSNARAKKYPGSYTNELNMEIFGTILGQHVADYDQFVAQHHDFLLILNPEQYNWTWLYATLMKESEEKHDVQIQLIYGDASNGYDTIALVHFGPPDSAIAPELLGKAQ